MSEEIFFEIHKNLLREGPGRNEYTRKAFFMLPKIEKPRILDIGCSPGMPTIELAKISDGYVIGLDNHQPYLDELSKRIKEAGLSDRMKVVNSSMFEMDFPDESFDIIWSEGSIYIIGFERGLKEWKRFLKPNGFLVCHEMTWLKSNPPQEIYEYWKKSYSGISTIPKNLKLIPTCGYKVMEHFLLPEDAWWEFYYEPLERRLQILREKYKDDSNALPVIENEQEEINLYKKYSEWYGSVFYIMKKIK